MDADTRKSLIDLLSSPDEEQRRQAMAELGPSVSGEDLDWLLAPLADESWRVRKEAIEALARSTPTPEIVDRLIPLMEPGQPLTLRNSVVEVLERMGPETAVLLVGYLGIEQADIRKFLVDILGNIADPGTVEPLLKLLGDPEENIRAAAAESLASIGDASVVDSLLAAVETADDWAIFSMIGALARLGDTRALPVFFDHLNNRILAKPAITGIGILGGAGDGVRLLSMLPGLSRGAVKAALPAVGDIYRRLMMAGEETAADSLTGAVAGNVDPGLADFLADQLAVTEQLDKKQQYIAALGLMGGRRAVQAILEQLDDDNLAPDVNLALVTIGRQDQDLVTELFADGNPMVRARAVLVAGRLDGPGMVERVSDMLGDDSGHVRKAAINSLVALAGSGIIPIIIPLLSDQYRDVALAAAQGVVEMAADDPAEVESVILDIYREAPVQVQAILLGVLGEIRATGHGDLALSAIGDEEPVLRAAAINSLKDTRSPEAVAAIIKSLTDESPEVRVQAATALEKLTPEGAMEPLMAALYDEDPWVRSAAVQAVAAQPGADPAVLSDLLSEGDLMITTSVVDALGRMAAAGTEEALGTLEESYTTGSVEVRRSICRALSGVPGKRALDLLLRALGDEDPGIRGFAAHSLAGREEAGVRAMLEEVMEKDPDRNVRGAVRSILEGGR